MNERLFGAVFRLGAALQAALATNGQDRVIQGYAAQAAVDSAHQIIIAADVVGSGSEQSMLAPMIEQARPWCDDNTLVTADAGYHSDARRADVMNAKHQLMSPMNPATRFNSHSRAPHGRSGFEFGAIGQPR